MIEKRHNGVAHSPASGSMNHLWLWLGKVLPYNILVSISVQYDTKSQVDDPDDFHTKLWEYVLKVIKIHKGFERPLIFPTVYGEFLKTFAVSNTYIVVSTKQSAFLMGSEASI